MLAGSCSVRVDPLPPPLTEWVTEPLQVNRNGLTVVLAAPLVAWRGGYHGGIDTVLSFGTVTST